MTAAPPVVLTIAGSDPSGGAGLQADLKTIHQHGGYGAAVPTLITVQSTKGVEQVELLSPELLRAQLACLLEDLEPSAAKTGALGTPAAAHVVGSVMEHTRFPWVVDPVWLPARGRPLSRGDMVEAYRGAVIPRATLVTPNSLEAELLAKMPVRSIAQARQAAERIAALGARAVLVKGGHLEGEARGTDVLLCDGEVTELAAAELVPGRHHGTGCALSAAIATRIAFGDDIRTAVEGAKTWLTGALARSFAVGRGAKPVNHLWPVSDEP
jgi:hydroxymethylpyrimidine/phosphomethylpyrimidine kinase